MTTILVADDNIAKRYIASRWLQRAGFTVVEAADGAETLNAVRARPDLVVLDVRLPDISGFEVCRRIKADTATAHIPVIHLSAHVTSAEDRVHGLEGGADAYLTHPVEPDELIATVNALLRMRRAESALRASEERYRFVARATRDVIWDWDLRTGEMHWNAAAERLFARRPAEIGRTVQWWHAQIHPEDRPRVVTGLRAVLDGTGELWLDEYRLKRSDGRHATVYDRAYVAHDDAGRPVRMIGSMLDVTDRRHEEERQRLLAEAGRLFADSLSADGLLERVARFLVGRRFASVCMMRGAGDAEGLRLRCIAAADPVTELRVCGEGWTSTPEGQATEEWMAAAARATAHAQHSAPGLPMLASVVTAPLRARGRTLGVLLLARAADAPAFDQADALVASELALRAALALDNALLYENALVANRAKSDFLAVMSHELRTPLNAIVGYTELLSLGGAVSGENGQRYLDRMRTASKHLLQLIEQILTLSRIEAAREALRIDVVDVRALAEEAADLVAPAVREKGLALALTVPPSAVSIQTDVGKVRQILLNLLSNAVKFTEEGQVELSVKPSDEGTEFRVSDSGIGIAEEHLELVFDSFWQVEQRKTRRAGGSGLGLAVSRRLARLLGGDLQVESRLGTGSTFVLRVPKVPPPRERGESADDAETERAPRSSDGMSAQPGAPA